MQLQVQQQQREIAVWKQKYEAEAKANRKRERDAEAAGERREARRVKRGDKQREADARARSEKPVCSSEFDVMKVVELKSYLRVRYFKKVHSSELKDSLVARCKKEWQQEQEQHEQEEEAAGVPARPLGIAAMLQRHNHMTALDGVGIEDRRQLRLLYGDL